MKAEKSTTLRYHRLIRIVGALLFVQALVPIGCERESKDDGGCKPGINDYTPKSDSLSVNKGESVLLSGVAESCADEDQFEYHYYLSNSLVEDKIVSSKSSYKFLACDSQAGTNKIRLEATGLLGNIYRKTWKIKVLANEPVKPECLSSAMESVMAGDVHGEKTGVDFQQAYDCLDDWTDSYTCDGEAHYAAVLSGLVLVGDEVEEMILDRANTPPEQIRELFDSTLADLLDHAENAWNLLDKSFSFHVDFLLLNIFDGKLEELDRPTVYLQLGGEHDYTDLAAVVGGLRSAAAFGGFFAAYNGLMPFLLSIPHDLELWSPPRWGGNPSADAYYMENEVFKAIDRDPELLTLSGPGGEDGVELMRETKQLIIEAIDIFLVMFDLLAEEQDDQTDDMIRYWDCGPDSICPGDPAEPQTQQGCKDINFNGECDPAHADVGIDPGEASGGYNQGEPIGIDRIYIGWKDGVWRELGDLFTVSMTKDEITNIIDVFYDNLTGDEPLVPDRLLGPSFADTKFDQSMIFRLLSILGVPIPEIRLGRFFDDPGNLRDMVPVYTSADFEGEDYYFFYFESEREEFRDVGYDGVKSNSEPHFCGGQILIEPLGAEPAPPPPQYCQNIGEERICAPCNLEFCHQIEGLKDKGDFCADNYFVDRTACEGEFYSNPDPSGGYDQTYDNDFDGESDELSPLGIFCADSGPEGNIKFDFLDLPPKNGRQDPGEPCEPFSDSGIGSDKGTIDNGIRDEADLDHDWPPAAYATIPTPEFDPSNGVRNVDEEDKLIDGFYLFLPDPTFSGALIFGEEIVNTKGAKLNNNAKLMRAGWKGYETYETIMEAFGGDAGFGF